MNGRTMLSPVGMLLLQQTGEALSSIRRVDSELSADGGMRPDDDPSPLLREAERQLLAYFAGRLRAFDLPLDPQGSDFDKAVWRALAQVPYGEVRSYGELAKAIGKPKASRAVGGACSRNPLLVVVPCHRAVGATGKLTGFAAGMQAKKTLLMLEGFSIHGDRIVPKTTE